MSNADIEKQQEPVSLPQVVALDLEYATALIHADMQRRVPGFAERHKPQIWKYLRAKGYSDWEISQKWDPREIESHVKAADWERMDRRVADLEAEVSRLKSHLNEARAMRKRKSSKPAVSVVDLASRRNSESSGGDDPPNAA